MSMRSSPRPLQVLVVVQLVIFLVSLPGLGLETRAPSQYAAWAGPVFLGLTFLVFALGVSSLGLGGSRPARAVQLGAAQAVAAIATNVLDFSHVGGPPPPTGPLVLGVISIVIALAQLASSRMLPRGPPPTGAPGSNDAPA